MGTVRLGRLVNVYDQWAADPSLDEATRQLLREATAKVRALPQDDQGRADLPVEVPGDADGMPPAETDRQGRDPALTELTAAEVVHAVAVGALVPVGSGERDCRRKWHRLLGVWKSCGTRARLISDLRPANGLQPTPPTFSLPSPADAAWADARWAAKADLSSAFWTLELSDRAARAMSTRRPGTGEALEWRAMPFGWTWAPYIFHTALEPLMVYMRARHPRCRFFKYLDDFLIISPSRDACAAALGDLRQLLEGALGFSVANDKTSREPVHELEFLGVRLNFRDRESSWPLRHAQAVRDLARGIAGNPRAPLVMVRRFLGKLAFLCQLCPVLAVWRRPLDDDVTAYLARDGGVGPGVPISAEGREAAAWWADNATALAARAFPWPTGSRFVIRCDASEWAGGVTLLLPDGTRRRTTLLLPPWLIGASSGAREFHVAIGALECLRALVGDRPLMRAVVDIYTDSQASRGALRRGARVAPMRADGQRLADALIRTGATVSATWLPREELDAEDAGSRRVCASDARLHPDTEAEVLQWAWAGHRPDLDAFATAANARAARWLAMRDEAGSAGVDGLRAPWTGRRIWAYPPAALARRARERAVEAARRGSAVVLVGPAGSVETDAQRTLTLPERCIVLPPSYDGAAARSPVRLVAALFGA